jgi:hypothetical protein
MMPLIDFLRIAALLLASAGLCGAALVIAARLKLDRFWLPRTSTAAETAVHNLADLADFARSGGLISIAAPAASMHLPLLSRGINLLIEGRTTPEVRAVLQQELDRSAAGGSRERASTCLAAVSFLALAAALISSLAIATSAAATAPLVLGVSLIFPAAFGFALHGAAQLRSAAALPEQLLLGMFAIETVCLIGARRDGQAVRDRLDSLLPSSTPVPVAAAA